MWFHGDSGVNGLGQAVHHVGSQCLRSFKEVAQSTRWDAGVRRNLADEAAATVNGTAQVTAESIFLFCFNHPIVPLDKLWKLIGDRNAVSLQLFEQLRRNVVLVHLGFPCSPR